MNKCCNKITQDISYLLWIYLLLHDGPQVRAHLVVAELWMHACYHARDAHTINDVPGKKTTSDSRSALARLIVAR